MTARTDQRRTQRRRRHVETARRDDGAVVASVPGPSAEEIEGRWATVRFAVAVACLFGAQILHWSVIDQHAREWPAAGDFFFVLALVEGLMTILVIARLRPWVAAAGIFVSIVPVVIWAWDRSLGLPFGPTKGVRGTIGRSDVLSVVFEVLTVVALWPFLRPNYGAVRPSHLDIVNKVVIGATVVYVGGFSYWAILGDQGTIHGAAATATAGPAGSSPATVSLPTNVVASAPTQSLSYIGKEFSFNGPTTVAAAVTRIELRNQGSERHELQVARIPEAIPTPSNQAALGELFADALFAKSIAPTIIAGTHNVEAGQSSSVTVDLTPGRYILACAIPAPNGVYHYAQGMITVLTVTAPKGVEPSTTAPGSTVLVVPES